MSSAPAAVVATTTWNAADMIDIFLGHYRRLGAAAVIVLEYGSEDGTRERLEAWRPFTEVVDLPSLAGKDTSNTLLAEAKKRYPEDWWCLFCDPDEFLVTNGMNMADVWAAAPDDVDAVALERRNMTGLRSLAASDGELSPLAGLTLRIEGRVIRDLDALENRVAEGMLLEPPWIYTAVPGKIVVRLGDTQAVEIGDHGATTRRGHAAARFEDAYILHYPFRGYAEFSEKMELARLDFEANDYPWPISWQYRYWLRRLAEGRLRDEYLDQFVPDEGLKQLLADGTLVQDTSVLDLDADRG